MPSEDEVRARIDTLTAAIERQRRLLEDLEEQRSAAKSELNTILAPIARLPVEICIDILLRSLPTPITWAALTEFSHVCRQWRAVVLCTPIFWTWVHDAGIPPAAFPDILATWLERGQGSPVSLVLREIDLPMFSHTALVIKEHAPRVGNLELCGVGDQELKAIRFALPALKSFTLVEASYSPKVLLEILCGAPNLVELNVLGTYERREPETAPVTHLNLECLHFDGPDPLLLDHFTLPSLQRLEMSQVHESDTNDLRSFLTRSNPPLRFLRIILQQWEVEWIVPSLKLVPQLTDLEVELSGSRVSFFDLFATNPDILPDLRNIVVDERYHHPPPSGYQGLVGFLSQRRKSLRSLRFLILEREKAFFLKNADVREFQEHGIHIHIGTEYRNFLAGLC